MCLLVPRVGQYQGGMIREDFFFDKSEYPELTLG